MLEGGRCEFIDRACSHIKCGIVLDLRIGADTENVERGERSATEVKGAERPVGMNKLLQSVCATKDRPDETGEYDEDSPEPDAHLAYMGSEVSHRHGGPLQVL